MEEKGLHGQELEVVNSSEYLGRLKLAKDIISLGFLHCNIKQCTKQVKAATFIIMVRLVLDYVSTV